MIRVKLEGKERYTGGDGWKHEESQVLKKNLEIQLGGEVLPAGEHRCVLFAVVAFASSQFLTTFQIRVLLHYPFVDLLLPTIRVWQHDALR